MNRRISTDGAVAIGGLIIGAALGLAGSFFAGQVQAFLFVISSLGLIAGSLLLAMRRLSSRDHMAAAGFAALAIGEAALIGPGNAPAAAARFASGVMVYVPALLLIGASGWGSLWARLAALASAVVFAAYALAYLAGGAPDPNGPMGSVGYLLLTLAIVGWIMTILREPDAPPHGA